MAKSFRGHPLVIEALDKWLSSTQTHRVIEIMQAALVGRTDTAKAKVLTYLSQPLYQHRAANTLLEGWGMGNEEVATRLRTIAFGPPATASRIADLFPRIIEDTRQCQKRLVELFRDADDNVWVSPVLEGLESLGDIDESSETASMIIEYALRQPRGEYGYSFGLRSFLHLFGNEPRVRELAKVEASRPDGDYLAVASAYEDDAEIRESLIRVTCPLPEQLRVLIAVYLGSGAGDDDFALPFLELYDHDHASDVLTQGSISYHARLKASGRDLGPAVEKLSRDIIGGGPDYEERRQAALAGLLTLGRPGVMSKAEEPYSHSNDRRCRVTAVGRWAPNLPLLKLILRNWIEMKAALGDGFWTQLAGWSDTDPIRLWDEFCLLADEYPTVRDEALAFLETRSVATTNILSFISRVRPKSHLLLENCLHALGSARPRSAYDLEQAAVAAELLGKNFGHDQEVLERLLAAHASPTGGDNSFDEALILALCEGWPESEALTNIFKAARDQNASLSYVTFFQLICRKSRVEVVFDNLLAVLEEFERNSFLRNVTIVRPIARRLQADDDFLNMTMEHIEREPTPSEKATIARLVAAARGVSPQLRQWCLDEAGRQMADDAFPEVGFDLVSARFRPVVRSLLDILRRD